MAAINIRELTHNFSRYLKAVKEGRRITVLERNIPVADIVPHNEHVLFAGWKRPVEKIKIKGESLSRTIVKNRRREKD